MATDEVVRVKHPFGELLTQYRLRKPGLTQTSLAELAGYDQAVLVRMGQGKKDLTGPSGRERVVRLTDVLRAEGALRTLEEANALLAEAGLPPLYAGNPAEAALLSALPREDAGTGLHPVHNLPAPLTRLIGREHDLAIAHGLLQRPDVRLLTLVGVPGVGKTRMAIELAARACPAYTDGACFVALASIGDLALVGYAIADALGLRIAPGKPVFQELQHALQARHVLLVLDNFEQVLAAGVHLADLLMAAPRLKILITSRASLRISAEYAFDVPPLALPPDLPHDAEETREASVGALAKYAAVELFVERARATRSSFELSPANARAVAAICRRLDGLPLAIELAAAHARMFTPQMLYERLDHGLGAALGLLTDGLRDLPPRQQTLRGTIEWSYNLLGPDEQMLFRHLGVFVGGFTIEAMLAICAPPAGTGASAAQAPGSAVSDSGSALSPSAGAGITCQTPIPPRRFALGQADHDQSPFAQSLISHLQSLVDHSLVQQTEGLDGGPRFSMLETIRAFAVECLEAQDAASKWCIRQDDIHYVAWQNG
jgi:hypothetical protein